MLFEAVFYGFWASILVYTSCECGQQFTDAFSHFDYVIGELDWHLLPIEIQRLLPMIIMNAQQPMMVKCYGNISCGRETFKKVTQTNNTDSIEISLLTVLKLSVLGGQYRIQVFHVSSKVLQMKRIEFKRIVSNSCIILPRILGK